jgi:hypothetical protein
MAQSINSSALPLADHGKRKRKITARTVQFHLEVPVVLIVFGDGRESCPVHGRSYKESRVRRPGGLAAQLYKVIELEVGV